MKRRIGLLLVLVISSVGAAAQDEPFSETQLTPQGQKAFQTLLSAPRFEDVSVGIGGDLSELVAAYRVLLREERRVEAFKSLLERATIAGQLYAICGLYDTDHKFFLSVVDRYKRSRDFVDTLSGCRGGEWLVRKIIFLKGANVVRLSGPKQPFDEWERKAKLKKDEGYMIDIMGGGYPTLFRGYRPAN